MCCNRGFIGSRHLEGAKIPTRTEYSRRALRYGCWCQQWSRWIPESGGSASVVRERRETPRLQHQNRATPLISLFVRITRIANRTDITSSEDRPFLSGDFRQKHKCCSQKLRQPPITAYSMAAPQHTSQIRPAEAEPVSASAGFRGTSPESRCCRLEKRCDVSKVLLRTVHRSGWASIWQCRSGSTEGRNEHPGHVPRSPILSFLSQLIRPACGVKPSMARRGTSVRGLDARMGN